MENIEKAKASGNQLTQTIDEEGNLSGVTENVDFESREVSDAESTQLRNELLVESKRQEAKNGNIEMIVEEGIKRITKCSGSL